MQYEVAQAPTGNGPDAVLPAAAPSGADTGAPPTGQLTKEQRDERARVGREIAEARRIASEANARADYAVKTAYDLAQEKYQRDLENWNRYLATLSPADRAVAELGAQQQETQRTLAQIQGTLAGGQAGQAPPQQRPRMTPEQIADRKAEILAEIANATGVQLEGTELGIIGDRSEGEFVASARAIAMQHAAQPLTGGNSPPPGRPISPRAIGGSQRITSEQIEEAMWDRDTSNPQALRKKLKDYHSLALRQAGQS